MIYLSKVTHPNHRAMTQSAAAAWMLDVLQLGANEFPWVFDDVKTNQPIDIVSFRATLKNLAGNRKLSVQSVKGEKIIIFLIE